jgi:hypothetical protein
MIDREGKNVVTATQKGFGSMTPEKILKFYIMKRLILARLQ